MSEWDLHNSEVDTAFDEPGRVAVLKAMKRGPGDARLTCRDREGTAKRPASDRAMDKSQRGFFLWVFQNLGKSSRTGRGSGTIRSLLPLARIRS